MTFMRLTLLSLGLPTLILAIALPQLGFAEPDYDQMRQEVLKLGEITTVPQVHEAEGFETKDGIRAIYFDALDYEGKPTRVFAWLGMPEEAKEGKVPAMVLVHGGGGTAFREWVALWTDKGYAAISLALEGQTDLPREEGKPGKGRWSFHDWPGPSRTGIYDDMAKPLNEHWMYHAVADTILGHNLMRSLPEVDMDNIGLMGMSWGGVLTSTVIGIDTRFTFAIPVYGCGHLFDSPNHWGAALGDNQVYRKVWDPMVRMDRVEIPVLWLSWPRDNHFPLDCLKATYTAAPGPRMISLIPKMGHSGAASWRPPDSYAFADSIVEHGRPWCQVVKVESKAGQTMATFDSLKKLDSASLIYTTGDEPFLGDREWIEQPVDFLPSRDTNIYGLIADVPEGATGWYFNVYSGKLVGSSDFQTP